MAVNAMNAFTAEFANHLSAIEGNLFASPFSIHAALSLGLAGARSRTAKQMADVLRQSAEFQGTSLAQIITDAIAESGGPQQVNLANAIWAQTGMNVHKAFETAHAGLIHQVDFANATETARQTINDWVSHATAQCIRELLGPSSIGSLTRLILTNAVYFKADWREKFDPEFTVDLPFHLQDETIVKVPTMCQTADFRVYEDEQMQAIHLWYEGFRMSMQIFVPRRIDLLSLLEKAVLTEDPQTWQEKMAWRHVEFSMPRFRTESSLFVASMLRAMGMIDAFDSSAADFGNITASPFWLSEVIHKSFVDVDEEGTEAAGATAALLSTGGGAADYEPAVVKIDRAFVFTICGHSYGDGIPILFVGRVVDPRS